MRRLLVLLAVTAVPLAGGVFVTPEAQAASESVSLSDASTVGINVLMDNGHSVGLLPGALVVAGSGAFLSWWLSTGDCATEIINHDNRTFQYLKGPKSRPIPRGASVEVSAFRCP